MADWTVISTTLGASFITGSVGYLSARWQGRVAMEQARMEIAGRTRLTDPHAAAGRGGLVVADENESYQTAEQVWRAWKPARRKPRSLDEQRAVEDSVLAEVAEVCKRYGAIAVTDQYKAAGVVDRLRRLGVSAVVEAMTETTKTNVYRKLRARLVARELELYPQPELLSELRRIRTRFAAGRARVEIPRIGGSHGDIAQALGLACWRLRTWTGSGQPGLDLDDDSNRRGRPRGDRLELLERIVPLLVDEPILSANEILAIVRGRRADVLRVVAVLRAAERVGASDRA